LPSFIKNYRDWVLSIAFLYLYFRKTIEIRTEICKPYFKKYTKLFTVSI
jgi:hypothetical protein